ncbi:MAG: MBL fold metallo-hydrolase [Deltaproteobacteria bacterium]|nr:MBL fold metallo-hydrolase [Deltaproteobacteria bacterium]
MIEISDFGKVKQVKLAAELNGEPYYWVSSYLVDGLLIDTGSAKTLPEFSNFLRNEEIQVVVNTHSHEDHIGANRLIQEEFGLPIYASKLAIPKIQDPPTVAWYREQAWGSAQASDPRPIPPCLETSKFRFEVVDTPGHSADHISFAERNQGWVFSGDLFIGNQMTTAGPEMNISDMLRSMRRLIEFMDDGFVLFTSLRTVRIDGRKTLQDFVARFEELRERAREMATQGLDVREIVNKMFGGENLFDSITNGEFSSAKLVRLLLQE